MINRPQNNDLKTENISYRKVIARMMTDSAPEDQQLLVSTISADTLAAFLATAQKKLPEINWPKPELAPTVVPLDVTDSQEALPKVDWLIITWTQDEHKALCKVFTPTVNPAHWILYSHNFASYVDDIRPGAPARKAGRIGSYCLVKIGDKKVLCFKSEFHMNQDGKKLPLKRMIRQTLDETGAKHILSIGTSGGVSEQDELGDVVISNSATFDLKDEFKNETFNHKLFTSNWTVKKNFFDSVKGQMISIQEPGYAPPTKRVPFQGDPVTLPPNSPNIHYTKDHPIITTDYFEFGNSANHLDSLGSAVEMDDAVIAMVCDEMQSGPKYAFVRNISDPVINGDLDEQVQIMWAVWFYKQYGIQTSFNGALATWAMIAGN